MGKIIPRGWWRIPDYLRVTGFQPVVYRTREARNAQRIYPAAWKPLLPFADTTTQLPDYQTI